MYPIAFCITSLAFLLSSDYQTTVSGHAWTDPCQEAARVCDFRFDSYGNVPTFSLSGEADVPFTSRIISKKGGEYLGVLHTNNITPEVISPEGFKDITQLNTVPSFTATHFKPLSINYTKGSALGHQVLSSSQKMALEGNCVRVYFSSYQVLNYYGHAVGNKNHVSVSKNKCVVFRTK